MSNNFLSSSFLRWLTLYLLLALAILLFVVNLFPQTSQGATSKTPPVLTRKEMQETATAISLAATRVSATATANANATATAIAKNPITLVTPPVELPLTISDPQGLIKDTTKAQMAITDQVQTNSKLKDRVAALVIVYVGVGNNDPKLIANAQTIAGNIESILQNLSKDSAFVKSVYRSVIYVGMVTTVDNNILTGTNNLNEADLEIYLYSTS